MSLKLPKQYFTSRIYSSEYISAHDSAAQLKQLTFRLERGIQEYEHKQIMLEKHLNSTKIVTCNRDRQQMKKEAETVERKLEHSQSVVSYIIAQNQPQQEEKPLTTPSELQLYDLRLEL